LDHEPTTVLKVGTQDGGEGSPKPLWTS